MKDFTYYYDDNLNLVNYDCEWLYLVGLLETRWILDAEWLMAHMSYSEWINA